MALRKETKEIIVTRFKTMAQRSKELFLALGEKEFYESVPTNEYVDLVNTCVGLSKNISGLADKLNFTLKNN